ncbi:lipopolysaccharide assembly protein LapA domain-containing protein [Pseudomonas sp. 18.1.10]|uniref:lipopolysaccharide assembly protein LapA domain-containing protein n=1 Tax=Pseudomonas sp. 18.1.10 TaxID=2969302 RepID=UPI0021503E83|nr:lipopolysaccharide assembly protein LapA domain-containing protein [Pseudomonas sp. 18.1.10]MCR4538989.1 lipopolysaccharide assembly protein LapA domain-containing protein [Pseudomonas sp. 18.1.10]
MGRVGRIFLGMILVVFTLAVIAFVLENQQSVALSFLGWTSAELPVAVFVGLALIVGVLIGPFLGVLVRRRVETSKRA